MPVVYIHMCCDLARIDTPYSVDDSYFLGGDARTAAAAAFFCGFSKVFTQ